MKQLLIFLALALQLPVSGQKLVTINFKNDYADVYHLSLIIYTPESKNQTRVSNVDPYQVKTYTLPVGSEIYVADWKQEAYAMQGKDIRSTGVKPTLILTGDKENVTVFLSAFTAVKN